MQSKPFNELSRIGKQRYFKAMHGLYAKQAPNTKEGEEDETERGQIHAGSDEGSKSDR